MNKIISILNNEKDKDYKEKITYKNIYKLEQELIYDYFEFKDIIRLLDLIYLNKDYLNSYCDNRIKFIKDKLININNEKIYLLNNKFIDSYKLDMLKYKYLSIETDTNYYKFLIKNLNDKINILKNKSNSRNIKYEIKIKKDYKKLIPYLNKDRKKGNLKEEIEFLSIKKMIFDNHLYLLESYYNYLYDNIKEIV